MPRVLDLDNRPVLENLDELRLSGETFRLMPDLPLGLVQDLQTAVAAGLTARKSATAAQKPVEDIEQDALAAMNEHISFDVFALAFHPDDQARFRAAMRTMFVSDVAKLFQFIVDRTTGGAVPLDVPARSSLSPGQPASNLTPPSSTQVPPSDSNVSMLAVRSPGLPQNFAQNHATVTTTVNVPDLNASMTS